MADRQQLPFTQIQNSRGEVLLKPLLNLRLSYQNQEQNTSALLDTGADVNVLPSRNIFEVSRKSV